MFWHSAVAPHDDLASSFFIRDVGNLLFIVDLQLFIYLFKLLIDQHFVFFNAKDYTFLKVCNNTFDWWNGNLAISNVTFIKYSDPTVIKILI